MRNDEKKLYGQYVREVRERLGMYREEFGELLGGLSGETIRHVEGGHQNLGKSAIAAVERLASAEVRETPPAYRVRIPDTAKPGPTLTPERAADLMLDDELRAQAGKVAAALGCDLRKAMTIVIENRLENS